MSELPIRHCLTQLLDTLKAHNNVVLAAPPGSGKTTGVPPALLEAPWLEGQKILMLEPRRLAARAAAQRLAWQLGERVGETVGYHIRFDRKVGPKTRIEVITEGVLTRRLQQDAELDGVGLVIFDEFHERSLHADLSLALCRDTQGALREDLKLLVMSATLDTEAVSQLLDDAPIVTAEGRSYPVSVQFADKPIERPALPDACLRHIHRALAEQDGDLLVFLPGAGEIRRLAGQLQDVSNIIALPLYGDLSQTQQDQALQPDPQGRRRIILATPIAETSLTIEGISTVIDSGLARRPRFDANSGMTRLETVRISRASAEQRAGRAGRLGPGHCYRLWTELEHHSLAAHSPAEISEADLAPLSLELARWGVQNADDLAWLDPPPSGTYQQARQLLVDLQALDDKGRITAMGKRMAELPTHPRLAHMLLNSPKPQQALACDLAALLDERDILSRNRQIGIDIDHRLHALRAWRDQGRRGAQRYDADANACQRVDKAARQYERMLKGQTATSSNDDLDSGALLSLAYPDRIAQRRSPGSYRLSNGRGVRLSEGETLGREALLVIAALDAGQRDGRAYLAASVDEADLRQLHAERIQEQRHIGWQADSQSVIAERREVLGSLVLGSTPIKDIDPHWLQTGLIDGIRQQGLNCLPWNKDSRELQTRIESLRHWQPDAAWPDCSDAGLLDSLEDWLAPWMDGMSRLSHLKNLKLRDTLQAHLGWDRQQQLEQLAPTHLQVPSGSRHRLQYEAGQAPVLAVRLQEMFGLADTPTVCRGQIKILIHLLSPAQRPIQVTQDLRGFWDRTYAEVKKELKGRYPKHYWPDDPWTAEATRRVRPK